MPVFKQMMELESMKPFILAYPNDHKSMYLYDRIDLSAELPYCHLLDSAKACAINLITIAAAPGRPHKINIMINKILKP